MKRELIYKCFFFILLIGVLTIPFKVNAKNTIHEIKNYQSGGPQFTESNGTLVALYNFEGSGTYSFPLYFGENIRGDKVHFTLSLNSLLDDVLSPRSQVGDNVTSWYLEKFNLSLRLTLLDAQNGPEVTCKGSPDGHGSISYECPIDSTRWYNHIAFHFTYQQRASYTADSVKISLSKTMTIYTEGNQSDPIIDNANQNKQEIIDNANQNQWQQNENFNNLNENINEQFNECRRSKNLLDIKKTTYKEVDIFEYLEDDWMHFGNTSGNTKLVRFENIEVNPNTKYSIKVETKEVTGQMFIVWQEFSENNQQTKIIYPRTSQSIVTASGTKYVRIGITTSNQNSKGDYKLRLMINEGESISSYENYGNVCKNRFDSVGDSIESGFNQTNDKLDDMMNSDINDKDKELPDSSSYDDYSKTEKELLDKTKEADLNILDVGLDMNSSSWVWDTLTRLIKSHSAVFGMFIAILSIGVIKLVLGR